MDFDIGSDMAAGNKLLKAMTDVFTQDKLMEQRKIIGYKLIREYPKSNKLGWIDYETGWIDYPDYYEPVYEEEKLEIIHWDSNVIVFDCEKGKLTQEIIDKIKEVISGTHK